MIANMHKQEMYNYTALNFFRHASFRVDSLHAAHAVARVKKSHLLATQSRPVREEVAKGRDRDKWWQP